MKSYSKEWYEVREELRQIANADALSDQLSKPQLIASWFILTVLITTLAAVA